MNVADGNFRRELIRMANGSLQGSRVARFGSVRWLVVAVLFVVGISGCAGGRAAAEREIATDDVIAHLRTSGIDVQSTGPISQPFLTATGQEYQVTGGGRVQIFEYQSAAGATLDFQQIDTGAMTTAGRPHLFQRENIIAIYIGDTPTVEDALADLLGNPY